MTRTMLALLAASILATPAPAATLNEANSDDRNFAADLRDTKAVDSFCLGKVGVKNEAVLFQNNELFASPLCMLQ